jgi:8-oxo-dGTP diphosphatase
MPDGIVDVAVGVIIRSDGKVLLGDRPQGKPWAGWWELPGGKVEPGESVLAALSRELEEELGIHMQAATPWVTYVHQYPTTTVRLYFCRVTQWQGEPQSLEQQKLKWVDIDTATDLPDLLPAAYPPLRWLQLPNRYLISSAHDPAGLPAFMTQLEAALTQGVRLVQWREPAWQALCQTAGAAARRELDQAIRMVLSRCQAHGAKLLINSVHDRKWWQLADGVHLRALDAQQLGKRPDDLSGKLVGLSTHNESELELARLFAADFAVLGPVLSTESHPGAITLGWEAFERLNQTAGLPVFAIGGQTSAMLTQAQSRGAHGIAGIRHLLNGPATA